MNNKWSRRNFSKAIISAQLLLASGLLSLPLSCLKTKSDERDYPLDDIQQETLKFVMDQLIPANDKMPSASEIGSVAYVLNILEELPELTPLFVSSLDKIDLQSTQNLNSGFSNLDKEQQIAVLTNFEQIEPELFKVLKDFTYESYYTNEKVHELIKYEPHPTGTLGPKMEPFDESLLDRVKDMPSIYIKI